MAEPLTLVFLAAGLGSRYGGLKQLEGLGPGGATLIDYSLYDGLRAGFSRAVFVIRAEIESEFERRLAERYRGRLELETVCQRLDALPPGFAVPPTRSRPWGTTQAVLAARSLVRGPFAVLNADDLYGREAIGQVAEFLRGSRSDSTMQGVAGYRLDATVSPTGAVTRAILSYAPDGMLKHAIEMEELVRTPDGDFAGRDHGTPCCVDAGALVSMNLWAFTPAVLPVLARAFERFLKAGPRDQAELRLSEGVEDAMRRVELTVRVLPTISRWCGVTHPADREWVRAFLHDLVQRGEYPERPWEATR